MVRYRRSYVPGGTFSFTVALADRQTTLLATSAAKLGLAFHRVRDERPLDIGAIVTSEPA